VIHAPFRSRQEHFVRVGSTNDVVAGWLESGVPEVCLATADEQTAGRGRDGRTWQVPAGAGLLLSLGFRPAWSPPDAVWRLAAVTSLAMAEAAEEVAGLADNSVRLKWPNDLVLETDDLGVRKLAGVLGETTGLGSADPKAIVGLGINVNWSRDDFPADLAAGMTSLGEAAGGAWLDQSRLLGVFLDRLEAGVVELRAGRFAAEAWQARQVTTGRLIDLVLPVGDHSTVRALGVDPRSGGLLVADPGGPGGARLLVTAEVVHVRLSGASGQPIVAGRV
jgi:BirA family biotin operon repressor/biotin-[acetyl-CoA-carboxylase] ligase